MNYNRRQSDDSCIKIPLADSDVQVVIATFCSGLNRNHSFIHGSVYAGVAMNFDDGLDSTSDMQASLDLIGGYSKEEDIQAFEELSELDEDESCDSLLKSLSIKKHGR